MTISQDMFSDRLFEIIKDDTPEDIIHEKGMQSLLLHDLKLDYDLFGDLISELGVSIGHELNANALQEYLPIRIGLFDRYFGRVEKKYFSKFSPISIRDAAQLIYDNSSVL